MVEVIKTENGKMVVNEQIKRLKLPIGTVVGKCPKCGEPLVISNGKFGRFISCSAFKKTGCKNTYNIETFKVFDKNLINKLNVYDALKHDRFHTVMGILGDKEYMKELPENLQKELWRYNGVATGVYDYYCCNIKVTL